MKRVFPDTIEPQMPDVIFYKSTLNDCQKTFETLIYNADQQNIGESLFACGLMSFKNPNLKNPRFKHYHPTRWYYQFRLLHKWNGV